MQLVYTQEAKAFLSHEYADGPHRPLLPVYMANGTRLIAKGKNPAEQRSIAGVFMCKLDACHSKILHRIRPFMFKSDDGLFSGLSPIPAYDPDIGYDPLVLPAVDVLVDFDILVGMTYLYPHIYPDNTAVRREAGLLLRKAFARIHVVEQIIQRTGATAKQ